MFELICLAVALFSARRVYRLGTYGDESARSALMFHVWAFVGVAGFAMFAASVIPSSGQGGCSVEWDMRGSYSAC